MWKFNNILLYNVNSNDIVCIIEVEVSVNMIIKVVLLTVGFFVLIKGADFFVDGASGIAGNFKVPKILIGLTVIAFGTSLPEFAVSVKSIISGNFDIVLGNVIGSNIFNILFILGISSLFKSVSIKENTLKKEIPMMILLFALVSVLMMDNMFDSNIINNFSRNDGVVILIFFLIFIYYLISLTIRDRKDEENIEILPLPKSFIFTICGTIMIIVGSNLVVENASNLAKVIGVSERMIALTIVSLGTSLPELVTSVVASRKGESDIAIGNVVGSNIFNIGIVLGIPVCIFGGIDRINFNLVDLSVMLISGILLFLFSLSKRKITKKEGLIFIAIFVCYYIYILLNQ